MPEKHSPPANEILIPLIDRANNSEQDPSSLQSLASILNIAFSHLNHLSIHLDEVMNFYPFMISSTDDEDRTFPRQIVDGEITKESEELPVFNITVRIGAKFNVVEHLPALTRSIEALHNKKMKEYGVEHPMMFIDTSKQLGDYWHFIANKIGFFIQDNGNQLANIKGGENEVIIDALKSYLEICEALAQGFSGDDENTSDNQSSDLRPTINNTAAFELGWQKNQVTLENLLHRLVDNSQNPNGGENRVLKKYQKAENKKAYILKVISVIGERSQVKIIDRLNTQAREAFFHHCEAELFRKTGMDKIRAEIKKEILPKKEDVLLKLKAKLGENKKELEKAKQENKTFKVKRLINKRVKLQINLAKELYEIVYDEKLFKYKTKDYSFKDTIENHQVNCVMRTELLHLLWNTYCEETSLAAFSEQHIFATVMLANGQFLSLDGKPHSITLNEDYIYTVVSHSDGYQTSLIGWKAGETSNPDSSEQMYRESIRLSPNSVSAKINLAKLLSKDPSRHNEAEIIYKRLIKLLPYELNHLVSLAHLLRQNSKRYDDVEKLYNKLITLDPDNPRYISIFIYFLNNIPDNYQKIEKLTRKLIFLEPNNPLHTLALAQLLEKISSKQVEAEEIFRKLAQDNLDPYYKSALAEYLSNQPSGYNEAKNILIELLRLDPGNKSLIDDLINLVKENSSETTKIIDLYNQITEINSNIFTYQLIFVKQLIKAEYKYRDLLYFYDDLVKTCPDRITYVDGLIKLLNQNAPKHAGRIKLYRSAMRLRPKNASYVFNLAKLLIKQPEGYIDAEQLYKEAIRLDPTNVDYLYQFATYLISSDIRRYEEALEILIEARDLITDNQELHSRDKQDMLNNVNRRIEGLERELNQ